ncbi:MAG: hypothetical protein EXR79_04210 [Myxococcales bacterium]|nr:hypothetical protein [Myxococcales bacterium]
MPTFAALPPRVRRMPTFAALPPRVRRIVAARLLACASGFDLAVLAGLGLAMPACSDPLALAQRCKADADCASAFCSGSTTYGHAFVCAEPSADTDGDGLVERDERAVGTNPKATDTDGDGLPDKVEVGASAAKPRDGDSDGKPDAVESATLDTDADCIADSLDAANTKPAASAELAAAACGLGVCAGKATGATCDPKTHMVACEVAAPSFEAGTEHSCDALDNDCDGQTDEALDGKAGPACGATGVCTGATASLCSAGKWICNLGKLPGFEPQEKTCDGVDNDCDGVTDAGELCTDAQPCTLDSCASAAGCVHEPAPKLCSDGNPCTQDLCDTVQGCRYVTKVGSCDDGKVCTQGESCVDGACKGGSAVLCEDGSQCTIDQCDPVVGCVAVALGQGSACVPGDPCKQAGVCDKGTCVPTVAVSCDDGTPCTTDTCAAGKGTCVHEAAGGTCNDGNACTESDTCQGSVCVGKSIETCCKSDLQCADSAPCTAETCVKGSCQTDLALLNGKACEDGNVCTKQEQCVLGVCVASGFDKCSDDNPCTVDVCDPQKGCQHQGLPEGASCDDGDVCDGSDVCQAGGCKVGTALTCKDANPCTLDVCDKQKGCQFTPHTSDCDDLNACTVKDSCSSGTCLGTAVKCDDKTPCTADGCDPKKGCVYVPVPAPCSDGSTCTSADACKAGSCVGAAIDCGDGNPCTLDSCDGATGCQHDAAATEGTGCDDGSACTLGDTCKGSVCATGTTITCDDKNSCTDDNCDIVSGSCKHTLNTAPCTSASACTTDATCKQGVCKGTEQAGCCKLAADCDDGNPCSIEQCNKPAGTCTRTLLESLACDDGSKCTVGDTCKQGVCSAGNQLGCDDGKACTAEYCLAAAGCQTLQLVTGPCSNGNPCDGAESCSPKGCVAGKAPDCDDANPCTLDGCDQTGCTHAFLQPGKACSDSSACTANDSCDGKGSCKGTPTAGTGCCSSAADCDDGSACTTDTCSATTGACVYAGLQCGTGSVCKIGYCEGGTCTAGNACANPVVLAEGFEATVVGWSMQATETEPKSGAAWEAIPDVAAAAGARTLHVGYATGSFRAAPPELGLQPAKYVVQLQGRLDVDGNDCSGGSLQVQLDGKALGELVCAATGFVLIERAFSVPAGQKGVRLSVVFVGAAKAPDAARGAWIDAFEVRADPADATCGCK